jgi:hypothetical protein
MRVAALADVHGNAVALDAVLDELEREQLLNPGSVGLPYEPEPGRHARSPRRAAAASSSSRRRVVFAG